MPRKKKRKIALSTWATVWEEFDEWCHEWENDHGSSPAWRTQQVRIRELVQDHIAIVLWTRRRQRLLPRRGGYQRPKSSIELNWRRIWKKYREIIRRPEDGLDEYVIGEIEELVQEEMDRIQ